MWRRNKDGAHERRKKSSYRTMPDSETSTLRRLRNTLGSNLSVFGTFHSLYGRRLYRNEREPNASRFSIIINGIGKCMTRGSAFYLYSIVAAASLCLSRSLSIRSFVWAHNFGSSLKRKISQRSATIHFLFHVSSVIYTAVYFASYGFCEMQPADRLAFGRFRHLAHHHMNNKKLLVLCACAFACANALGGVNRRRNICE